MNHVPKSPHAVGAVARAAPGWLERQAAEDILEADLPIVDPHHHLWDHKRHWRYLLDELRQDTGSGHRIVATVFVDCLAFYRADGPVALRPVGETEFANGVAAMCASGVYGPSCAPAPASSAMPT
jgi:L-fuconolactonase